MFSCTFGLHNHCTKYSQGVLSAPVFLLCSGQCSGVSSLFRSIFRPSASSPSHQSIYLAFFSGPTASYITVFRRILANFSFEQPAHTASEEHTHASQVSCMRFPNVHTQHMLFSHCKRATLLCKCACEPARACVCAHTAYTLCAYRTFAKHMTKNISEQIA